MECLPGNNFNKSGNVVVPKMINESNKPILDASEELLASGVCVSDSVDKRKVEYAMRMLSEYNIEVKITERKSSKKVFVWRKGSGNLHKGVLKTNEFMLEKLGCEIEDIVKNAK